MQCSVEDSPKKLMIAVLIDVVGSAAGTEAQTIAVSPAPDLNPFDIAMLKGTQKRAVELGMGAARARIGSLASTGSRGLSGRSRRAAWR